MAFEFKVPENVSYAVRKRIAATPEDPPTLPSVVPIVKEEEDDFLPDLEEDPPPDKEPADAPQLDPATLLPRKAVVEHRMSRGWTRVRSSAAIQLGLMIIAGSMVIVGLYAFDDPPHEPPIREASDASRFPTIEITGAPPVTEEEIARRLRAAEPERASVAGGATVALTRDEIVRQELKAIADLGRRMATEGEAGGAQSVSKQRSANARHGAVEGHTNTKAKSRSGRWFSPGGTMKIEGARDPAERKKLPLAIGDRLSAKLEVGISSGHAAPVLARLSTEVRVGGRVVAPEGAIAKGRFQADAHRVFVTFNELILPTGERLSFEGYAIDKKIPGLIANRIELSSEGGGAEVVREGVDVAKEVMRSVASGSIVGRVAEGALPDSQPDARDVGFVLEVPAGKQFQIVVTGGDER